MPPERTISILFQRAVGLLFFCAVSSRPSSLSTLTVRSEGTLSVNKMRGIIFAMTLYDYPEYYEIAFSFRDIPDEARFMHSCIERYSKIPVRRVFEVACGYAPHAEELTALGYKYIGLDNNRNMLDYAAHKWSSLKPPPEFMEGNMLSFS